MTTTKNNEHKKLNFSSEREQSQACLNSAEHEKNQGRKVLNVPNLRFPEFQGEWKKCTLNEVCKFHNGRAYKQTELLAAGKYRVLRVGNFFTNDSWYYSNLELEDNKYAQNGDLLYAWSASFGPRFWREEKVIFHYHIWKIDSFKNVDKNFLYHFLDLDSAKIKNEVQGGTMVHITKGDMEKRTISYPSVPEQRNIARFLFLLDERIATQNKIIEDLKKLKSAIIEKHYSQVKKRTTCIADLGEPFSVGSLAKDDLTEIGSPCVIYGELFTTYGEIIFHIESCTNKTDGMILSKKGDLLFPSSTTVDAMSLIAPSVINVDGVVLGGDMFGIHISHNYNAQYLSYYFNHIAKKQLAKFAKGSTIIHLHYKDIEKAKLLLPSLEEQNRMAKCLVALDKKASVEQNLLSSLTCQKSYLLQQMFI